MTCGIYELTIGSRKYVGKSTNIERRWNDHQREMTKQKCATTNPFLQCCFNKYGITDKKILIVVEKQHLNYWEKHFISCMQPDLNLTKGGGGFESIHDVPENAARMSVRMSKQLTALHQDPVYAAANAARSSARMTARHKDPIFAAKTVVGAKTMGTSNKGRKQTPEATAARGFSRSMSNAQRKIGYTF
jgi:hypothetical protein